MKFANYGTTRRLYLHSLAFRTTSVSYYFFLAMYSEVGLEWLGLVRYSGAFYVRHATADPWPCEELHKDAREGCTIAWRGDVVAAWLKAKLIAGWEVLPAPRRKRTSVKRRAKRGLAA